MDDIRKEQNIPIIDIPAMPSEEDYIVCYIDVLGSRDYVSSKDGKTLYEKIYDAFVYALEVTKCLKLYKELEFKVFSDNILVGCRVEDISDTKELYEKYRKVAWFIKDIATIFMSDGILFRGGITLNKLAISEIMVWGEGLVEVVKIEEQLAIYPRIVISQRLLDRFQESGLSEWECEEKFHFLCDSDGCKFFDYINYGEMPLAKETIKESYKIICEKIKTENSPKILQKYNWHKGYLEKAKDIYNEYYGEIEKLEL